MGLEDITCIKKPELCRMLQVERHTIDRLVSAQADFPRPIKVGERTTLFLLREVVAYINSRKQFA